MLNQQILTAQFRELIKRFGYGEIFAAFHEACKDFSVFPDGIDERDYADILAMNEGLLEIAHDIPGPSALNNQEKI
jgi:hypothetical protein